ncbi:MAG: hypothetical protein ACRCYO_06790 [Bacteroidia bacterium]
MKRIHFTLLLSCLCPLFLAAQVDTSHVERIRFIGGGVGVRYRTTTMPDLPANTTIRYSSQTGLSLGQKNIDNYFLTETQFIHFAYTIPIQKRIELQFGIAGGKMIYQKQDRIVSTITNVSNTTDYDVSYEYVRLPKSGMMGEIQFAGHWLFLQRTKVQMGLGAGVAISRYVAERNLGNSLQKDIIQQASIIMRGRINQTTWIQFSPEVSFRYGSYFYNQNTPRLYQDGITSGQLMVGFRAGILFGKTVKCKIRPDHWYVRTYED